MTDTVARHLKPERKAYMKQYLKEYCKSKDQRNKKREYQRAQSNDKLTEYRKHYILKHPISRLITIAKQRAKKRNIIFTLTKSDVVWNDICPILNIKLEFHFGSGPGGKPNSPSLDRIDPTRGYVPGNVQVISLLANQMKSTANKEQLISFAKWIIKEYDNEAPCAA